MVELSICMVSLDCWTVLGDCLRSLQSSSFSLSHEVIIVDNGSCDGTPELVRRHFPNTTLIENNRNVGFTKATNQAIEASHGRYLLWLNTDTVLRPDSLHWLCRFLEEHPSAGIVGPKVLNADGSFQPQCKRGLPTPSASLFYLLKLNRLLPSNPRVGQYLLTHLPENLPNQVDAVSGCCLLARREVWTDIGPLDEDIFGFGEDLDWCVRAKKAGWEVWYYPRSVIVHLKGQGGAHSKPFSKVRGTHQAMWVFYRKHLMSQYPLLITALVWAGVQTNLAASLAAVWLRQTIRGTRRAMHPSHDGISKR